jgi:hypothetical protein
MKLGFKRGNHWYSAIVRALLNSQWSHGVVVIDGRLYESVALKGDQPHAGVRDYPITDEIAAQYDWFDIGGDDAAAVERYNRIKGSSYDFFSLLSYLPVFNVRDSKRFYCYELMLYMMGHSVKWRVSPEIILTFVAKGRS